MENPNLYQDDLTEERDATPEQRDRVASEETLDPDTLGNGGKGEPLTKNGRA